MKRVPEVLDCWFESGSMPYAQVHYPFENKEHFEGHFPADFISESLDQTRGWFYSLTVLAAALFDRPAFQNCIVSGMVLAADGKKMSKSQRNYTDPMEAINKFGADALRLYLMSSPVLRADDLCFTDDGVRDVVKSILLPLWSAYGFFVTYANIDGVEPGEAPLAAANPMDRWILSRCETMVRAVGAGLEGYDMQAAINPMLDFIDALNNWYIRRSRRRFWRSENDGDKVEAYATLYRVLRRLTLCMAPVTPFITETMWANLRGEGAPESVHLAAYPEYDGRYRDEDLEWKMEAVRKAVTMGRSLRYQHELKIRQPLAAVHLVTKDPRERAVLLEMEDIIRDELNVKEVIFREDEEELVEYQAKANFRALGKELGKDMKQGAAIVEALSPKQIASLLAGSVLVIEVAGRHVELTLDKVEVRRQEKAGLRVVNEGTLTVALDAQITQALMDEGNARDLVRGVQTLRKDSGLAVTDRIRLSVSGSDALRRAFDAFGDFVSGETLAVELRWSAVPGQIDVEAGDDAWKVALEKA